MSGASGTSGTTGASGARNELTLAVFLFCCLTLPARSQEPQSSSAAPGNGAINGTVVDSANGTPVSGAIVLLEGGPIREDYHTRQITDARGRFAFLRLANTGTYRVSVSKFGYLDGGYGRDGSSTDPLRNITVRDGAWVSNLRVPIFRPGEISGVVRDETGQPVVGVFVRAYGKVSIAGYDRLAGGPFGVTDDRGHYRLGRVLPGRYVVQVPSVQMSVPASHAPNSLTEAGLALDDDAHLVIGRYPLPPPSAPGAPMAYPPAFHPRAMSVRDADEVTLEYGESKTGIDITLTPARAVKVSGTVIAPPEAVINLTVRLVAAGMEGLGLGSETASASVAADGSFRFVNVPSGDYTLEAPVYFPELLLDGSQRSVNPPLPQPFPRTSFTQALSAHEPPVPGGIAGGLDFRGSAALRLAGRMKISAGTRDVSGISLTLHRLSDLRGRVVMEGEIAPGSQRKDPIGIAGSLSLDPADGRGIGVRLAWPIQTDPSASHAVAPTLAGVSLVRVANGFAIAGVEPGPYLIRTRPGSGWVVKSVTWRGRDHTTLPLDVPAGDDLTDIVVTVTNQGPTVAGVVRNTDGSAAGPTAVVIFPLDRQARIGTGMWPATLLAVTTGESGNYWLSGMPAGDYLLAAIPQSRLREWRSPARLEEIERFATRVSLRWGEPQTLDLTRAAR